MTAGADQGELFYDTLLVLPGGQVFLDTAHHTRCRHTARHFGFDLEADRPPLPSALSGPGPWRARIGYGPDGSGRLQAHLNIHPLTWDAICPPIPWDVLWVPAGMETDPARRAWKSRLNTDITIARNAARQAGFADALLGTPDGSAGEFGIGNLVILEGDRLVTPPRSAGILPGLMRRAMIDAADIPVVEEIISFDRLQAAEAVALTNALRGIVPVGSVHRKDRTWTLGDHPRMRSWRESWKRRIMAGENRFSGPW